MPCKPNCAANFKLPTADRHVHTTASKEGGRNIGLEGGNSISPDEDVVDDDELAGKGEAADDLVGLPTPNVRTGAASLRSTKEAVAARREKEGAEKG